MDVQKRLAIGDNRGIQKAIELGMKHSLKINSGKYVNA